MRENCRGSVFGFDSRVQKAEDGFRLSVLGQSVKRQGVVRVFFKKVAGGFVCGFENCPGVFWFENCPGLFVCPGVCELAESFVWENRRARVVFGRGFYGALSR